MTTRKIFMSPLALAGLSLATMVGAQPANTGTMAGSKVAAPKESAKVGPFEVAPHWSGYSSPKSIPEGRAFHMVVAGDTLWDIAGRYLGNPYLWPQIWEVNPYVKKARLIYPGDPIFLPSVQMADAPVAEPAVAEPPPPPPQAKASEPMRLPEWLDPDALINVASTDTVRNSGYISASMDDESIKIKSMERENGTPISEASAGTREYVYLSRGAGSGVKAGDLYSIHRRSRVVRHPVTGKKVGYRIDTSGIARIVLVGESSARAVIEVSGREVLVGDYLRPLMEVESPLVKRRVVSEGGDMSLDGSRPTGYVVDIEDDSVTSATGSVIGVDVGSGSGMAVGKVITVFRLGDRRDNVTRRALGAAVVLAVRENFSVARLVYSREEIRIGDRVILQP